MGKSMALDTGHNWNLSHFDTDRLKQTHQSEISVFVWSRHDNGSPNVNVTTLRLHLPGSYEHTHKSEYDKVFLNTCYFTSGMGICRGITTRRETAYKANLKSLINEFRTSINPQGT